VNLFPRIEIKPIIEYHRFNLMSRTRFIIQEVPMRPSLVTAIVAILLFFDAQALPKFAARTNQSCQHCHVNPSGGGMRTFYGATVYGRELLPVPIWLEDYSIGEFSPKLNDNISIGADFRSVFLYQDDPIESRNTFFQMQSDLYLSARIARNSSLYLAKGIGNRFEAFGQAQVLPMKGYVKAGWFEPAYGLKMDDHTIFVRAKTLFPMNGGHDAGLEIGVQPGRLNVVLFVGNGSPATRDPDRFKAILGRAESAFSFNQLKIRVGGSYYNNAQNDGVTTLFGGFAAASLGANLTALAEVDVRREYRNTLRTTRQGLITFFELNYVVTPGLEAKVGYDFYDPDVDIQSGSEERFVVGLEFFPLSGIELRPQVVVRKEKPVDLENNQLMLVLHLYL